MNCAIKKILALKVTKYVMQSLGKCENLRARAFIYFTDDQTSRSVLYNLLFDRASHLISLSSLIRYSYGL